MASRVDLIFAFCVHSIVNIQEKMSDFSIGFLAGLRGKQRTKERRRSLEMENEEISSIVVKRTYILQLHSPTAVDGLSQTKLNIGLVHPCVGSGLIVWVCVGHSG